MLFALCIAPASVRGNAGPPSQGGQLVAEPTGIEDIAIVDEQLTIDLRPLADGELAEVEAVYNLQNRGAEKTLKLLFAGGAPNVSQFQVWLNDSAIPSSYSLDAKIPASWRAPQFTPGIGGGKPVDYLRYQHRSLAPRAFTITVPPGPQRLRVRYAAEAATHSFGSPTVYRQFAYVLAPARSWAGFGGLNLTIHLPRNWRAASQPMLSRQGDTLVGEFDAIPADAIALTLQSPPGWAYSPFVYGSLAMFGLAVLGGGFFCWRVGRGAVRRRAANSSSSETHTLVWPISLVLGFAWGAAVLATGFAAIAGPSWMLPTHQAGPWNYGHFFAIIGVFLLSLVAAPIGFTTAQIAAMQEQRRLSGKEARS